MALVKFGGGIIQMSGSIAGNTFARNRYGNYVRARTKPVNPSSVRQQKIRSAVAELVEHWYTTLTGAQRTAWNLYADSVAMKNKLGETIKLSGFNHYIRSNVPILDMAATRVDAGPVAFTLPEHDPAMILTASVAAQQFSLVFDDTMAWCSEDDAYLYNIHGRPQNPTRNFFAGPYKGMRFLSGDAGAPLASPQVLGCLFPVALGQRAWVQFRIVRADGRISTPFTYNCIVAA